MTAVDVLFRTPRWLSAHAYQIGDLVRRDSTRGFKLAMVVGYAANDDRRLIRHYRHNKKKWSNEELESSARLHALTHDELVARLNFVEHAITRAAAQDFLIGPVRVLAEIADAYPVYTPPTLTMTSKEK